MKILILEDDHTLAQVFRDAFEDAGHAAEVAHTNAEAFSLLRDGTFDILLCDLLIDGETSIPVLDYAQFVQPRAEVILVTGSGLFPSGELHFSNAGVSHRVQKPVRIEDLLLVIEHFERTRSGPAAESGEVRSA